MKFLNRFPGTPLSDCRKNAFAFITISIIIFAIYANTYNASWHFDDTPNILDRDALHLKKLTWPGIKNTFFWNTKFYRPISSLSLALNYYVGGEEVFGYHLINTLIHFISALFLFLFIHHSLRLSTLSRSYQENAYNIALLATLFWATNPIQTQAVSYIIQRMASMAGMFYIMAFYFYVKGRTHTRKSSRITFYLLCALTAIFSFGSKENSVVFPLTLLLYEILIIQGSTLWEWLRDNKIFFMIIALGSLFTALIYLYIIEEGHLFNIIARYGSRAFSLKERLLTEPRVLIFYISLILYPIPSRLSMNHDIDISHSLLDPASTFPSVLLILSLIIGSLIKSKRWPVPAFCILFFFLNHLVESTILPLELIFEHRNYIPSMLLFVPVTILILKLISHFSYSKTISGLTILFVTLLLIAQGHSTFMRNFTWKTDESLWLDAIEKYPDLWRPHHNLASYYEKNNRLEEAKSESLLTLSKKPSHNLGEEVLTYFNLGLIHQKLKNEDEALFYYQKAEKIYPQFAPIYSNRGGLLIQRGFLKEAITEYKKAILHDQEHPLAYGNLGFLQLLNGDTGKALYNLELAQKKGNVDAKIFRHLGHAYRIKGLYGKAFLMFDRARKRDPYDPLTLLHLAELYLTKGMKARMEEIVDQFFRSFRGNILHVQNFIEDMAKNQKISHAIIPNRIAILTLLVEECRRRARIYQGLADFSHNKKK